MTKEKATERTRNWSFIIYEDSRPNEWKELLNEIHIPYYASPLHDKDINPTGEIKKAHRHIILEFEGVKTYKQVEEITKQFNGTIPIKVNSMRSMIRYLTHIDNPEKAQYSTNDIITGGGADYWKHFNATSQSRYELIGEMVDFINDYDIEEYWDIYCYAKEFRKEDWFPILTDNATIVIREVIRSNRHRDKKRVIRNKYTGEILQTEENKIRFEEEQQREKEEEND